MGQRLSRRRRWRVTARGWHRASLLLAAALLGCAAGGGKGSGGSAARDASRNAPEPYRAMLYSEEFGQRFGLPGSGVHVLDTGLLAVAVEIAPDYDGLLQCALRLYVDAGLDISFPASGSGDRADVYEGRRDLFFVRRLSDADFDYLEAKLWRHANRLLFRSRELSWEREQGFFEGTIYERYAAELVPGIAMLSFGFICTNLDPELGPAEVWVLRSGDPDYVIQYDSFDPDRLYRFRVPERLQRGAWPRAAAAVEYNDRVRPDIFAGRDSTALNFDIPE